jgi:hypothetical protein
MKNMLSCAAAVALSLGLASAAWAKPPAAKNSCWGQVANAFARLAPGTMGQHSRAGSPFIFGGAAHAEPAAGGDPPFGREGVAGQTRVLGFEPSEGGNGDHAIANTRFTPLQDTEVANCDGPPTP